MSEEANQSGPRTWDGAAKSVDGPAKGLIVTAAIGMALELYVLVIGMGVGGSAVPGGEETVS